MEAQQVSSAVQIYKIFSKKGFTEEEAGIIATALEQKDNLATKDDVHEVVDKLHQTNSGWSASALPYSRRFSSRIREFSISYVNCGVHSRSRTHPEVPFQRTVPMTSFFVRHEVD